MVVRNIQYSFTSGEVAPQLISRLDNDLYKTGLQQARNVYLDPRGYVTRREGLQYIDMATNNGDGTYLIDFAFNTTQTYLIVFTPGKFKVYKNDVLQATVTTSPINTLTNAQLARMKFTQSADTLLLFLSDVQTIKITRTSDTNWIVSQVAYTNISPYPFNGVTVSNPAASITPSLATGRAITVTASASVFTAAHVGQFISYHSGGLIYITGYTSGTVVTGDVHTDLVNVSAVAANNWDLETGYEPVWSATRGWPSCGCFYQGRLYLANSGSRPQTLWGSRVGDFFNMDVYKGLDADGIDETIDDDQVNAILNIFPGINLQLFTTGGEYYVPTDATKPITPTSINIVRSTNHGSNGVAPVSVDGSTVFIEYGGNVVRDFTYNELEQTYNADNISILSPHLIVTPVDMELRQSNSNSPTDYLYIVNSDGTCAVLNSLRSQNLRAWTLLQTQGSFERVAVVNRQVYFTVKRVINGTTYRYIEKLNPAYKTDCAVQQTVGTPQATWTGFSQLEGQSVRVIADNYIFQNETVTGGQFTCEDTASTLEAGLMFTALIQTMPVDLVLSATQSFTGDWRRLVFVNTRLYQTRNIIVKSGRNTYKPPFRQTGSFLLDQPVPLYTGWKKTFIGGIDRDISVIITQEDPLEFCLLGIVFGVSK